MNTGFMEMKKASSLFCIDPRVWYPMIMMALQNNATLKYKVPAQAGVYDWCFWPRRVS